MRLMEKTPGFSVTAKYIENLTKIGGRSLQEPGGVGLGELREELWSVWNDCREPDWDGRGAFPVTRAALRDAYLVLEALPPGYPLPSIGAEPDGHLTLEWHHSRRRTLSVSVSPEGELHYAGLFGPNQVSGTEVFFSDIPDSILRLIGRVYGK